MAKEDWGTKRLCQSCATKFYDFGRTPIVCPKCATTFDPETLLKSRRTRPSASKMAKASKPATVPVPVKSEDDDIDAGVKDVDDENNVVLDENDDDDDSVLQDASDLGGDDVKDVVGDSSKGASSDDR